MRTLRNVIDILDMMVELIGLCCASVTVALILPFDFAADMLSLMIGENRTNASEREQPLDPRDDRDESDQL